MQVGFLFSLFNMFSGPISGIVEKGILSGVAYGVGKGIIDPASASGVAAGIYTVVSAVFTGVTKSTTGKALSLNTETNGLKVVDAQTTSAPAVVAPTSGSASNS